MFNQICAFIYLNRCLGLQEYRAVCEPKTSVTNQKRRSLICGYMTPCSLVVISMHQINLLFLSPNSTLFLCFERGSSNISPNLTVYTQCFIPTINYNNQSTHKLLKSYIKQKPYITQDQGDIFRVPESTKACGANTTELVLRYYNVNTSQEIRNFIILK
jgi:hypothetical protein